MKRHARRIVGLIVIIFPIVHAVSCGQGTKVPKSSSEKRQRENLPHASVGTTIGAQRNNLLPEQFTVTANQAPAAFSTQDVPQANDLSPDSLGTQIPPDPISLSQLPYYCDPRFYAPNIINSIRACNRFQPIPYIGFGRDRVPPIAPLGPIGYRIKDTVGHSNRDDDDDFHHHRHRRSHRH